jgi:hypothetical protein
LLLIQKPIASYDLDVTKASLVNLLEEEIEPLELLEVPDDRTGISGGGEETKAYGVKLSFRGFEVKTIKLEAVERERRLGQGVGCRWHGIWRVVRLYGQKRMRKWEMVVKFVKYV